MDTEIRDRLAAWDRAADAMRRERARALSTMTDDEARAVAEDLLSLVDEAPPKGGPCGLVEQQRIFARLRG